MFFKKRYEIEVKIPPGKYNEGFKLRKRKIPFKYWLREIKRWWIKKNTLTLSIELKKKESIESILKIINRIKRDN